jgi:hypothetical protein
MAMKFPGINCYCHFCGGILRFQIARAGETVNCFDCGMETVLFIPGLQPPYSEFQSVLEAKDIRWAKNPLGMRYLEGLVENKSAKHLDWIRVEFILYNRLGVPVGTTSDCLISVPPGKVWKLQAAVSQPDALQASEPLLSCEYGRIHMPFTAPTSNVSIPAYR